MILFKACPRCGGDVDTSYAEDVYCIQCAYRPTLAASEPRLANKVSQASVTDVDGFCPRCDSSEVIALEKLRVRDNICYRCRLCGHIFSPRASESSGPLAV